MRLKLWSYLKFFKALAILSAFNLICHNPVFSQAKKTRMLIIFDCSYSMLNKWGNSDRITIAKNILTHMVDSMGRVKNVEMALRCYGYQYTVAQHNCEDSRLVVPFGPNNAGKIIEFVKKVQPMGYTPIGHSLTQAATDFPDVQAKNVIMLITDGIEECGGDPCAASKALQDKKVVLEPYIIGIGLNEEKMKFFDCVGKYYSPKTENDLAKLLSGVISQALDNTTLEVDLLDNKAQPTQTDVSMTLTDEGNNKPMYTYMHTLRNGKPDSFPVDPNITYNLKVFTLPPLSKDRLQMQVARNNKVKLDASQGNLQLKNGSQDIRQLSCIIRQSGKTEIVAVQELSNSKKYLVGNYDLEVLTLPRTLYPRTRINPGETTVLEIPAAGKLDLEFLNTIIGSIYIIRDNKQEWLAEFQGSISAAHDFYQLQPGDYKVVYRLLKSINSEDSKEESFHVTPGTTVKVTLK